MIIHGWPETDDGLPEDLQLYYSLTDELAYHAGCVVKSNKVIVSEALRETILQRLHGAHLGMSKMKVLAQERVYWPKMHESIESFVLWCKACQEEGPSGFRHFYLKGEIYLIIIDYNSNFPTSRNMVASRIKEVCVVLNSIFSEYRLPKELTT